MTDVPAGGITPLSMPTHRTDSGPGTHRPAPLPPPEVPEVPGEPQMTVQYWNHHCPQPGCVTWVPNHLRGCVLHPNPEEIR